MFFNKVPIACSTGCLHVLFALYLTANTTIRQKSMQILENYILFTILF